MPFSNAQNAAILGNSFLVSNVGGSQPPRERPTQLYTNLRLVRPESLQTVFERPESIKAFSSYVSANKNSVGGSVGRVHTNPRFYRPCR